MLGDVEVKSQKQACQVLVKSFKLMVVLVKGISFIVDNARKLSFDKLNA
jgi:hypothetical protein